MFDNHYHCKRCGISLNEIHEYHTCNELVESKFPSDNTTKDKIFSSSICDYCDRGKQFECVENGCDVVNNHFRSQFIGKKLHP